MLLSSAAGLKVWTTCCAVCAESQLAQAGGDDQFREDLRQQIAVWTTRTADADFTNTIDPDYLVLYRLLAGQVDHKTILEKGKTRPI